MDAFHCDVIGLDQSDPKFSTEHPKAYHNESPLPSSNPAQFIATTLDQLVSIVLMTDFLKIILKLSNRFLKLTEVFNAHTTELILSFSQI